MSSISKFAIAGLMAFSVLAASCKQNDLDPQNSTTTPNGRLSTEQALANKPLDDKIVRELVVKAPSIK